MKWTRRLVVEKTWRKHGQNVERTWRKRESKARVGMKMFESERPSVKSNIGMDLVGGRRGEPGMEDASCNPGGRRGEARTVPPGLGVQDSSRCHWRPSKWNARVFCRLLQAWFRLVQAWWPSAGYSLTHWLTLLLTLFDALSDALIVTSSAWFDPTKSQDCSPSATNAHNHDARRLAGWLAGWSLQSHLCARVIEPLWGEMGGRQRPDGERPITGHGLHRVFSRAASQSNPVWLFHYYYEFLTIAQANRGCPARSPHCKPTNSPRFPSCRSSWITLFPLILDCNNLPSALASPIH